MSLDEVRPKVLDFLPGQNREIRDLRINSETRYLFFCEQDDHKVYLNHISLDEINYNPSRKPKANPSSMSVEQKQLMMRKN